MRWLFLLLLLVCGAVQAEPERPNILLLVAEDLSPRLGVYGDSVAQTPQLDALAARSLRYTQAFTTAGVCAPSRAALVMGMHQNAISAQHMRTTTFAGGSYYAVPPAYAKAFPELLRAAGYFTYTDDKLDYQFSGVRANSGPPTLWSAEGRHAHWNQREAGQPFFGMINFFVTHESGLFSPLGHWPASFTHFLLQGLRASQFGLTPGRLMPDIADVAIPPYYPDIRSVRETLARHYGNIRFMDQQVGAILEALESDGLADNTIIIWTSDHGDGLPRAKRELYHSGIHVPLIVYIPERWRPAHIASGSSSDELVSFVDLAPTLLALAGVAAPDHLPGENLLDARRRPRQHIFAARDRVDEVDDRQRAVFDGRYKYIRSWKPELPGGHKLRFRDNLEMIQDMRRLADDGQLNDAALKWFRGNGREQLYDLQNDPHEIYNLANDPQYAAQRKRLSKTLDKWLQDNGGAEPVSEETMRSALLCGEQRCQTDAPILSIHDVTVEIFAQHGDESLEYRIDNEDWQLYSGALRVDRGSRVSARASRYGWLTSESVSLPIKATRQN